MFTKKFLFTGFGSTFGTTQQAGTTSLFGAKPTVSFGATSTAQPTGGLFGTPSSNFGTTGQAAGGGLFGKNFSYLSSFQVIIFFCFRSLDIHA